MELTSKYGGESEVQGVLYGTTKTLVQKKSTSTLSTREFRNASCNRNVTGSTEETLQ